MFRYLFFFLLTHFSIGLIFTILFVSLQEIGKLYFRLTTWLTFVLIVFALLSQPFGPLNIVFDHSNFSFEKLTYLSFILSCVILLFYNILHPRIHKQLLATVFIVGCAGIASFTLANSSQEINLVGKWLVGANAIASALILGTVLGAMITGHWYLVQHKLSIKPLMNSSVLFIGAVILKIITFLSVILVTLGVESLFAFFTKLDFMSYLFIGRVTIGLMIPLIFGIMVWKSAKIKSTQSATGILYATIILVLIGEAFSKFLPF